MSEHDRDFVYTDADLVRDYCDEGIRRTHREHRAEESFSTVPGMAIPVKALALGVFLGLLGWSFIIVPLVAFWGDLLSYFHSIGG